MLQNRPAPRDSALDSLTDIATDAGAGDLARDGSDLAERLAQGRFFVACVGQFKRGKSTLINALLGREVLPAGVVPVTTVVTIVQYGPVPGAQVRFADGRRLAIAPAEAAEFVSEANNPENDKAVAVVEVMLPNPLLQSGMCLVDTPGLGSVFAANSATTRAFVPQIDAAVVVLGTDPPISREELGLLEEVVAQVDHVVIVLNKSDRVSDAESREAVAFTRRVIERRFAKGPNAIYRVSALERMAGEATRDWAEFEEALARLADQAVAVVDAAAARGARRLARALSRELAEQRDALVRPLEQSERRLADLHRAISEADCALRELSARMRVEQVALSERFGGLRTRFLAQQEPLARHDLDRLARAERCPIGPSCRARVIDIAHDVARLRVTTWVGEIEPLAEALYVETISRFVGLANDFIARLAPADGDDGLTRDGFLVERGFRQDAHFFFTSLLTVAAPGFWTWVLDWVGPRGFVMRSSIRQASAYLGRLMVTNSARMANDLTARVEESQRRLEKEVRARLSALVESAARALERARARQASGAEAVKIELAKIDGLQKRVEAILKATAQA